MHHLENPDLNSELTVWLVRPVCYDSHQPGLLVESVNLVRQPRRWPEVLQVSVRHVREVQLLVLRVDRDVVERVELSAKVVVQQNCDLASVAVPESLVRDEARL